MLLSCFRRKLWCSGSNIEFCMRWFLDGLETHIEDAELQLLVLTHILKGHIH